MKEGKMLRDMLEIIALAAFLSAIAVWAIGVQTL